MNLSNRIELCGSVIIRNGKNLTTPNGGFLLETHGPYQHGGGDKFPAVNGAPTDTCKMCGNLPVNFGNSHTDGEVFIGLGQKNSKSNPANLHTVSRFLCVRVDFEQSY